MLGVGDQVPDVTLDTSSGEHVRLADRRGISRVLLVFYPKDFTPGCTSQLCQVQQDLGQIVNDEVEAYGVNPDTGETHERFRQEYGLEFPLVIDRNADIARQFGVLNGDGGIVRTIFVIGKNGRILVAEEGMPVWSDVRQQMVESIETGLES